MLWLIPVTAQDDRYNCPMKKQLLIIVSALVSLQSPAMGRVTNTVALGDAWQAEKLLWDGKFSESAKLYRGIIKNAESMGDSAEAAGIFDSYAWLMQALGKHDDAMA